MYQKTNHKTLGTLFLNKKSGILLIEFQNEFTTEGGKLHDAVKGVMAETKMLDNAKDLAEKARKLGIKVMHCPITFKVLLSQAF